MELRDYLQMLRRGWPVVAVLTLAAVAAAGLYVAVSVKTYKATASVVLIANQPQNMGDAQQGGQLAQSSAPTIAGIIDSPAVLRAVSSQLSPPVATNDLVTMVSAVARLGTSVIDITVTASSATQAADVANLAAVSAGKVIQDLEQNNDTKVASPLRLEQIVGASAAQAPTSPNLQGVMLIGLIVGLALGIAVAVLRQSLDARIYDGEDLRRLNENPVLAIIPRTRRRSARRRLEDQNDPFGPGGEGFRTLRTNLSYLESSDRRCFALTAIGEERDSASTAINLALSLAQAGRRTLLIDCDLRRDALGDLLGISHSTGLADVLGGFCGLEAATSATDHDLMNAIPAGTPQRNPSDLLSSIIMSDLLLSVEAEYDDVILHAPSLEHVSDAAIVARAAGWTILTVTAGRSTIRQLDEATNALERVHVTPVGLVLVGARTGKVAGLPAVQQPSPDPLAIFESITNSPTPQSRPRQRSRS